MIYFNTTGTKGGTKSIKQLLSYLNDSKIENVTNEKISHIHDYVTVVKQSAEVRDRYMTIGEMMDMSKAEGKVEGERLGRINSLLEILSDLGKIPEEIKKRIREADEETLKQWLKIAAKADGLEEFLERIRK